MNKINDTIKAAPALKDSVKLKNVNATEKPQSDIDKTILVIQAVGASWPFVLTIFAIVVFVIKWKTIWLKMPGIKSEKIIGQELTFMPEENARLDPAKPSENEMLNLDITQTTEQNLADKENDKFTSLYDAYDKKEFAEGDKILEALNKNETDTLAKVRRTFSSLYYKYTCGYTNGVVELESALLKHHEKEHQAYGYYYLGLCYSFQENYSTAKEKLKMAYALVSASTFKVNIISAIAKCVLNLENEEAQIRYLLDEAEKDQSIKLEIFTQITSKIKNPLLTVFLLSAVLQEKGNNSGLLFKMAYNLNEMEDSSSAISYYKQAISVEGDDKDILNNLGVAYDRLGIKSESISFFKKAREKGSSLGAANLSSEYISNGFLEEAQNILDEERKKEEPDEGVFQRLEQLNKEKKSSIEKVEIINENGKKIRAFFQSIDSNVLTSFGRTVFPIENEYFSSTTNRVKFEANKFAWVDSSIKYEVRLTESNFFGKAEYQISKSTLDTETFEGYYSCSVTKSEIKFIFFKETKIFELQLDLVMAT